MSIFHVLLLIIAFALAVVGLVFVLDPVVKLFQSEKMTYGYLYRQAFFGAILLGVAFYIYVNFI